MTSQPVEANVVLTSDNSQYDRAMTQSADNTDHLGMSIDNLGRKINSLSKTAGKTLIGISAADVATITAATAAWSSYEKQMSRLQAQSAILTRTTGQQTVLMKDYTTAVKGLRTEFGTTTTEAAQLVETLSKITTVRQSRDLQDLSKVFVEMSHATGESSEGLANSLTNLQKLMGTPISSKNTRKYADEFTFLAAQTNTSAQSLIDFSAQLAPVAKTIGMNTEQVAGFATAFSRAGQDGFQAANVFTKITGDIAHSMATGSPEIAHYANLLGVTQRQFKQMDSGEAVVEILEALQTKGKGAAAELSRLGLDGPRSLRAITAVLNQGGVRQAVGLAQTGKASDATAEGAAASTKGLSDEMAKLRQQTMMLAETFGSYFGPAIEKFVGGMTHALEIVNKIAEGPLGKFMALVMGVVAPLAGSAGALLLFAGALLKVAAAFTIWRNSMSLGVREGFKGGAGIARMPDGTYAARGEGMLGPRGAELAERGTWFQRGIYNVGQPVGSLLGGGLGAVREGWQRGRGFVDPGYTPGPPRSPLSYMAGGLGRGIDAFLTPQFDQMRYLDPTRRTRSGFGLKQDFPGATPRETMAANAADEARQRARTATQVYQTMQAAGGSSDPVMEQARKDMHRANQEAIAATRQSMMATKEATVATQTQTREVGTSATGFRRLAQATGGFAGGAVGAAGGGLMAGGRMLARSPLAMPMGGALAAGAMSAMGVQNNALMFGAMGAMFGSGVGIPIGATVGLGIDAYSQHQAFNQMLAANRGAQTPSDVFATSQALAAENARMQALGKPAFSYPGSSLLGRVPGIGPLMQGYTPAQMYGQVKTGLEGLMTFSNPISARANAAHEAEMRSQSTVGALTAIASRRGTPITSFNFKSEQSWAKLDDLVSQLGPNMDKLGVSVDDITKAWDTGGPTWKKMVRDLVQTPESREAGQRAETTAAGRAMAGSRVAQRSINFQEDVGAFYAATSDIFDRLHKQGLSNLEIMQSTEKAQAKIGDQNDRQYELQVAVSAKAQQALQFQLPLMGRAAGFQASLGQLQSISAITPRTQEQADQLEAQKTQTSQNILDQVQYFQQMLLMQQEYEVQRKRAQEDYNLQRSYQEQDYQLQRSRAEEAFNRSRARSIQDYYRSVRRAEFEFDLQRRRNNADFRHQIQLQAKEMATSAYDVYQRVPAQRTASATWTLGNARDQLRMLRDQEKNLNELRKLGFSDAVIQQLRLTDPSNAQQLARFVTEVRDSPNLVGQYNRVARGRQRAARALGTDESNAAWDETRRQHNLQIKRSQQDFERQTDQGHEDFLRGLKRNQTDFNIAMDQQEQDFETQLGRQETAFNTSMTRSAQDLARQGKEITGSITSILEQASTDLTGGVQKQAQQALKAFSDLRKSTRPEAIATMKDLAQIFGFKYTQPKLDPVVTPHAEAQPGDVRHPGTQVGMASGGVVPGWTPGRDTAMVPLSGGEAIMRPEWARAVGEGAINAMNHSAKYGGFASGGLVDPDARVYMDGEPVSKITKAQLLLAEKLSHLNLTTMQGSWQPYTSYSGSSHMGPGVVDESPGNFTTQYWLRRVGFAAWGRNFPGAATAGSGAHVHAVSLLDPGAAHQSQIAAFYAGQDGLGGRDYGPNPAMLPGLRGMLAQFTELALAKDYGGGRAADLPRLGQFLKGRTYPKSEAAAAAMLGVHPLYPGDISTVMTRMIKKRFAESLEGINPNDHHSKWYGEGGVFTDPHKIGVGEAGPEAVIPLNDQGAAFLATALHGAEVRGIGLGSSPMRGGYSVYNTRIDKSTNFTGPITVQANDPNELLSKLQARQRVMALSRPSLTGSAA